MSDDACLRTPALQGGEYVRCLENWLDHKRRYATRIQEETPGKPQIIRYLLSGGIEVGKEDLEEGGKYVRKEVWEKLVRTDLDVAK